MFCFLLVTPLRGGGVKLLNYYQLRIKIRKKCIPNVYNNVFKMVTNFSQVIIFLDNNIGDITLFNTVFRIRFVFMRIRESASGIMDPDQDPELDLD